MTPNIEHLSSIDKPGHDRVAHDCYRNGWRGEANGQQEPEAGPQFAGRIGDGESGAHARCTQTGAVRPQTGHRNLLRRSQTRPTSLSPLPGRVEDRLFERRRHPIPPAPGLPRPPGRPGESPPPRRRRRSRAGGGPQLEPAPFSRSLSDMHSCRVSTPPGTRRPAPRQAGIQESSSGGARASSPHPSTPLVGLEERSFRSGRDQRLL
jgi:hypothetical protein